MKLNTFFLVSAAAVTMASGAVNAADEATAEAIWTGFIGSSVPGNNLIITGQGGGDIGKGSLNIENDGTFKSSVAVVLEARDYDDTAPLDKVGEIQPDATWTYISSRVMVGGSITDDADVQLKDDISGTNFTQGNVGELQGGILSLSIANDQPLTDVDVEGEIQVSVQMSASYVDGL